jgi:hypothetical protein
MGTNGWIKNATTVTMGVAMSLLVVTGTPSTSAAADGTALVTVEITNGVVSRVAHQKCRKGPKGKKCRSARRGARELLADNAAAAGFPCVTVWTPDVIQLPVCAGIAVTFPTATEITAYRRTVTNGNITWLPIPTISNSLGYVFPVDTIVNVTTPEGAFQTATQ